MEVQLIHPDTGATLVLDLPFLTEDQIRDMVRDYSTNRQLQNRLDNLPLSAEGKAFLAKFLKFTIKSGNTIIKIGKKLLEITIMLVTKLKHLTFWTVLGSVLTFVISMIPIIGPILGAFLGPIILLGGLTKGFYEQIKASDPSVVDLIQNSTSSLQPLNGKFA